MRKRNRFLLICVGAALLCVGVILCLQPRPLRSGDPDGDGRYQRATWSEPDPHGSPRVLKVFVGADGFEHDQIDVSIAIPEKGLIGSFGGTSPDLVEFVAERFTAERPMIVWDLSNYPPGTQFIISTCYLDGNGLVIDTETISTTRPEASTPDAGLTRR